MVRLLQAPYPAPRGGLRALAEAVAAGSFVAVFLGYFRPFGLARMSALYGWERILIFGLITTVLFAVWGLLPRLLPGVFADRRWRLWHQLAYYLSLLLAIALANGTYINYVQDLPLSWKNTGRIILQTFALGSIAVSGLLAYQYIRKLNAALADVRSVTLPFTPTPTPTSTPALLAAEAHGNYAACWSIGRERELRRTTLTALLAETDDPAVVRCHRSWLVNLRHVTGVSGNAQGLQLTVEGLDREVPVSRTHLSRVRSELSQLG